MKRKVLSILLALIMTASLFPVAAFAGSVELGVPENLQWEQEKSATATWDTVENANYYTVTVYVANGEEAIGQTDTGTADNSIDVQQEINKVVSDEGFEYKDVRVAFAVKAQVYDNGALVQSGELSEISAYIDYEIGGGIRNVCEVPSELTLNSSFDYSFKSVEGALGYYLEVCATCSGKDYTTGFFCTPANEEDEYITGNYRENILSLLYINELEGKQVSLKIRVNARGDYHKNYIDSEFSNYCTPVQYTVPMKEKFPTVTNPRLSNDGIATWDCPESGYFYIHILISGNAKTRELVISNGALLSGSKDLRKDINEAIVSEGMQSETVQIKFNIYRRGDRYTLYSNGDFSDYSNTIEYTYPGSIKTCEIPQKLDWDTETLIFSNELVEGATSYRVNIKFVGGGKTEILSRGARVDSYKSKSDDPSIFAVDYYDEIIGFLKEKDLLGKQLKVSFRVIAETESEDYKSSDYSAYTEEKDLLIANSTKQIGVPTNPAIDQNSFVASWDSARWAQEYWVHYRFIDSNEQVYEGNSISSSFSFFASPFIPDSGATTDGEKVFFNMSDVIQSAYNEMNFNQQPVSVQIRVRGWVPNNIENYQDYIMSDYSEWSPPVIFTPDLRKVESITLSPSQPVIAVGSKLAIGKTVTPDNAYYETIDWKIEDDSIASVDRFGNVLGVKAGQTKLTATIDEISQEIDIYVYEAASNETNESNRLILIDALKGAVDSLANYSDADGTDITNVNKAILEVSNGAKEGATFYVDINLKTNSNPYYERLVEEIERQYGERNFAQGCDVSINCYYTDKQGENHQLFNITELSQEVEFEIQGNAETPSTPTGTTRTYEVYRMHDGVLEKIDFEKDANGNYVIVSDKFSDYIVVYYDQKENSDIGDHGSHGSAIDVTEPSNAKTDSGTVFPKARIENGVAKVDVVASNITEAIAAAKGNGVDEIVIAPVIKANAAKIEIALPTKAVKDIVSETDVSLLVQTDAGTVSIPNDTLAEIEKVAEGKEIVISIEKTNIPMLADKLMGTANINNAVAVSFLISSGEKKISSFGGETLDVRIPVDSGKYIDGKTYAAFIVSDDGSVEETTATVIGGVATVTMRHFSTVVITADFVSNFSDIKITDYFYDAVNWATENNITNGTDTTHFSPAAPVTRAQVVTFLWRAAGCPNSVYSATSFEDISPDSYYSEAVIWALSEGITKGTSNTEFSPDSVCTRGQIAAFLARFAGVTDEDIGYTHNFTDVGKTDYFNNAVAWAYENKVTEGTSTTTFSPNVDCTRAQVVTFLYRWLVR